MLVSTRAALALSRGAIPGALGLLAGVAFGPQGLGLLTPAVLSFLDPALPVALVAVGALAGLGLRTRATGEPPRRRAAIVDGLLTAALVCGGMMFVAPEWSAASALPYWFPALVLGMCAASSGALDDLVPIVAGALVLALLRDASPAAAALLAVQSAAIALVIAAASWLLLARSTSETEQRVFVIALLLLLGGAADFLALSALLSGFVAAVFLESVGGPAREHLRRDVQHFQHPLLMLILVVTGARIELAPQWIGLAAAYLFLRTAGRFAGGWVAGDARFWPGMVGIAFALNALRAAGPDATSILSIAAFGAIGSEIVASVIRPAEEPR